jgi:hypothetical protein
MSDYASAIAPIEAESPVKPLQQAQCDSRSTGFVPGLQRIAGYAGVKREEWLLAPHHYLTKNYQSY